MYYSTLLDGEMFSQIVEVHKCVLGSGFAQPTDWGHAMSWVCGASGGTVRCEHRHRRHPGRMRTISIPGERLLKDSDSRNNKGGRIAGVLIRVHYHHFNFPCGSLFLLTLSGKIGASWHLLWVNVLFQPFRD